MEHPSSDHTLWCFHPFQRQTFFYQTTLGQLTQTLKHDNNDNWRELHLDMSWSSMVVTLGINYEVLAVNLEKIAPNGRCGHLSDREICDGETREHVQTTSAKNFQILSPSRAPKNLAYTIVQIDNLILSYRFPNEADKYWRL